jgi:hypothetical protein
MTRYTRAAKAFEDFTGRQAKTVAATPLPARDVVGWGMGPVVGIAYEAVRDGERTRYFHEFDKRARPDLVASENGRQLYLAGGNYTVTDRGIEDMPELFTVNPSPRRRASSGKKTMAATKRNAKGRFVKGGGSRKAARRRAPTRQVAVFSANPSPKRRRRPAASAKRTVRRFRRNPSGLTGGSFGKLLIPAAGVGAGAVASELFMGYLPIPPTLKMGVMRHVTKAGVGLALGWAVAKVLRQKRLGGYIAAGAVVIGVHDAIKEFIASKASGVQFGQYVKPVASPFAGRRGMGYVNPAALASFGEYVTPVASPFAGSSQAYDTPGGETAYRA